MDCKHHRYTPDTRHHTCAVTKKSATGFINTSYHSCDVDCKRFATAHVRPTFVNRSSGVGLQDIRQLHQIHCSVPPSMFQSLVVSLVLSRLDYGNAALVGLPTHLVRHLQSVQNATARLIYHMRSADHTTDALVTLHWLHVPQRIEYKVAVMTYKVLHGTAPQYLGPLALVSDLHGDTALCQHQSPSGATCQTLNCR